jgi:hypothetical protein
MEQKDVAMRRSGQVMKCALEATGQQVNSSWVSFLFLSFFLSFSLSLSLSLSLGVR